MQLLMDESESNGEISFTKVKRSLSELDINYSQNEKSSSHCPTVVIVWEICHDFPTISINI